VPRDTTPTFELEMLVSGAVLFGLVQLPDAIHAVTDQWLPHVGIPGLFGVVMVNVIVVAAIYGLILCFVAHLLLRGYWVALVGVHSVFPHGARPDRMKEYGPVQAELMRESVRPLAWHIARVDNVASLVFASGFLLAASSFSSVLLMAAIAVPAWAAERVWGLRAVFWVLGAALVPLTVATIAAQIADYRMRTGTWTFARAGRASFARCSRRLPGAPRRRAIPQRGAGEQRPAQGDRRSARRVASGVARLRHASRRGRRRAARRGLLPILRVGRARGGDRRAVRVVARGRTRRERAPSLDSDVATGPYLRLFIPYRAMVHNAAMAAGCPGLRPLASADPTRARGSLEPTRPCGARNACTGDARRTTDPRPEVSLLRGPPDQPPRVPGLHPHADLPAGEHTVAVWPVRPRTASRPRSPPAPVWR
jgi:hypothetical protein